MSADPDEDAAALAWAGDEADRPTKITKVTLPRPEETTERPATPGMLLITYGVLAGIFLVYTIGWIAVVVNSGYTAPDLLGEIMWQLGEFLAIASPALWVATVLLLTRDRKPLVRLLLLLVGLLVVIPWPFLLGGAA
jgi:hypothetical protein